MHLCCNKTYDHNDVRINDLQRYSRNEQGSMSVTFALSLVMLLIASGVALDISKMHSKKSQIQDLIDNASLAAALSLDISDDDAEGQQEDIYKTVGADAFNFDSRFSPSEIKSLDFELSADGSAVTGSVRLEHTLLFGGILKDTSKDIFAKSVVAVKIPEPSNACIIVLDENAGNALILNSGANINAPNCEFSVHSTANPAIVVNSNVNLNVKNLCVAGTRIVNNAGSLSNLETDCDPIDNPFVGQFPIPDLSCDFFEKNHDDVAITFDEGVYCGRQTFNNGNAKIKFNPGLYVIKDGDWNINGGEWDAEGVTFYFADKSKLNFNSGFKANITAQSSGPYSGVAILETDGLQISNFNLSGQEGFDISGLVYLPSRDLTFNSGVQFTAQDRDLGFVVNKMIINDGNLQLGASTILSATQGRGGGTVTSPFFTE